GSGERALGNLATSAQINRYGISLINNTGTTLSKFTLNFTGERWRLVDPGVHDTLAYEYAITSSSNTIDTAGIFTGLGSFAAPNTSDVAGTVNIALNGNLAANQTAKSHTVNVNWTPGSMLIVRFNGQDLSGQDDGLSVDNLSITGVPEPTGAVLGLSGIVGALVMRRRVRS